MVGAVSQASSTANEAGQTFTKNTIAAQIRDLLDLFWDSTVGAAHEAADKYANDTEGLPEVCTQHVPDV